MTNLELFENYLNLSYKEHSRDDILLDKKLSDYILLRRLYSGYTIYYLNNGSSLFIPWKWDDLFSGLYSNSGDQILFKRPENNNYLEYFIYLFTKLQLFTLNIYSKINGIEYLDTLGDICTIGTTKFINYTKEKFKFKLEPLEYKSLKKTFNI